CLEARNADAIADPTNPLAPVTSTGDISASSCTAMVARSGFTASTPATSSGGRHAPLHRGNFGSLYRDAGPKRSKVSSTLLGRSAQRVERLGDDAGRVKPGL